MRPAIQYVPEDLRDEPLFATATELIDAVRRRPALDLLQSVDKEVELLLPDYGDNRAVLAYYNTFIRPKMGTANAMYLVLKLLQSKATLNEWFNADFNLPAYKFTLDFAEYPEGITYEDIDKLIDLALLVKNERSHLAAIRQDEGFQDLFTLDNSELDDSLLDDFSGYVYRDVNIYLLKKHSDYLDQQIETEVIGSQTSRSTGYLETPEMEIPTGAQDSRIGAVLIMPRFGSGQAEGSALEYQPTVYDFRNLDPEYYLVDDDGSFFVDEDGSTYLID